MGRVYFSGGYGQNVQLEATCVTVSQDKAKNESKVRLLVRMYTNSYASFSGVGNKPLTIEINGGGAIEQVNVDMGTNANTLLFARDYTIGHNSDGTKSFAFSVKLDLNVSYYGSAYVWEAVNLAKIPRVSTFTIGTAVIGQDLSISINRADESFKHTVRYAWYGKSGTIAQNVDTGTSWAIPEDFNNDVPNSTVGQGTLWVDTYSGNTKIGEKSLVFYAMVADSIRPSLKGVRLEETVEKIKSLKLGSHFVQVLSNPQVNFEGAEGTFGSTVVEYFAELVGQNQSTNADGGTLGIIRQSGDLTIRAYVTDSRGRRSEAVEATVNVIEYFAPILSFSVDRVGATSSTLQVTRTAKIAPLTIDGVQKNTMTLRFKVAEMGSQNYVTDNGLAAGIWTTRSEFINSFANLDRDYPANKSFNVVGTIEDAFTSVSFSDVVTTEQVVTSYDQNGMGVNKIRERGALDIEGDVYIDGGIYIGDTHLLDMFYPIGTVYESTRSVSPADFMGGTWERFGNGQVLIGVDEDDSDFNAAGKTGGAKTHTLTVDEMPKHSHPQMVTANKGSKGVRKDYSEDGNFHAYPQGVNTGETGGGQPHNNLQPYITIYRWRRTA